MSIYPVRINDWYEKKPFSDQAETLKVMLEVELLEAAERLQEWLPCGPGVKPEEIEAWWKFDEVLAKFERGG